jgi:hypothetical protein
VIIGYIRMRAYRQVADNQRFGIIMFADEKKWTTSAVLYL